MEYIPLCYALQDPEELESHSVLLLKFHVNPSIYLLYYKVIGISSTILSDYQIIFSYRTVLQCINLVFFDGKKPLYKHIHLFSLVYQRLIQASFGA